MYPHEHDYDALIDSASRQFGVSVALIKAFIAQESGFDARAYRAEPQIDDASRGLMQLLYATARDLGYTGTPDGLFNPETNINLGTKYIADNIRFAAANGYALDSAISAYNGGFSGQRPGDGKRTTDDDSGPFINQDYVDSVLSKASYFAQHAGVALPPVVVTAAPDQPSPVAPSPLWLLVPFLVVLALYRYTHG